MRHVKSSVPLANAPSLPLLAGLDLFELLPIAHDQSCSVNGHGYKATYFNCAEKSSLVSSSSQLSSHRCVLSPGTSASSCVQSEKHICQPNSASHRSSRAIAHPLPTRISNRHRAAQRSNVLSTGKSSNSSSSSNAAAGFWSFVGWVFASDVIALVVGGTAPVAGAPDMLRCMWFGFRYVGELVAVLKAD